MKSMASLGGPAGHLFPGSRSATGGVRDTASKPHRIDPLPTAFGGVRQRPAALRRPHHSDKSPSIAAKFAQTRQDDTAPHHYPGRRFGLADRRFNAPPQAAAKSRR
jgi:hypothetical protein